MKNDFPASVIIPCYNCSRTILPCLQSLEKQNVLPLEIIAVDDGSTDNTIELLESFRKKSKLEMKIIAQGHAGPARARNLGAKQATGKIIVFFDSDCVAPPNWLSELLSPLQDGFSGAGCPYRTRNSESLVARYVGYEIAFRHEKMLGKPVDSFGSYSAAFFKKDFFSVGGFDDSFRRASGEDFALTFAMHSKGKKLFFTGKTFVWHLHPSSLLKFLKQQYWRGYWRVPLYLKNKLRALRKESYSGFDAQLQFFLSVLFLFSFPVSFFLQSALPMLATALLLFLSNLPFGFWCFPKEKKFLLLAPLIASLRSVSAAIGAIVFVVEKLLLKKD